MDADKCDLRPCIGVLIAACLTDPFHVMRCYKCSVNYHPPPASIFFITYYYCLAALACVTFFLVGLSQMAGCIVYFLGVFIIGHFCCRPGAFISRRITRPSCASTAINNWPPLFLVLYLSRSFFAMFSPLQSFPIDFFSY